MPTTNQSLPSATQQELNIKIQKQNVCQTFVHSTSRENSVSELLEWSKMNYCVFVINAWKGRAG